jgi:hypothetical protein
MTSKSLSHTDVVEEVCQYDNSCMENSWNNSIKVSIYLAELAIHDAT